MSSASRELHIKKAIEELRQRPGIPETERLQFRGHFQTFEVIELPLDVPILNARSFRIAPLLADHPKRDSVAQDPESAEAQAIVSDLVRKSHRQADSLRGSLETQGQANPGVVTRTGKLINGNSRCVLLRGLVAEGKIPASTTIRVAVLPGDTDNREELDLESVLQQQKEFKDEYNLVARLMMIQSLYDNGMTDEAIAKSLRESKAEITRLREVLVLMNRARILTDPALPLSAFVTVESQQQNWVDLLKEVRDTEGVYGREAADDVIRGWLIAYFSGHSAVHQLRKAKGDWITRDLVPHLAEAGRDGDLITQTLAAKSENVESASAPAEAPIGVDILDVDGADEAPVSSSVTQKVLNLVVQAAQDPEREFEMADGTSLTGHEIKRNLSRRMRPVGVRRRVASRRLVAG